MLKVLHLYKTYYPDSFGGIEQVIYQLSEAGNCHNIAATTLSLSTRGNINNCLIGTHHSNYAKTFFEVASTPFSVSAINRFRELAAQADIIHYHFPYPFMDMLHFIVGIKKPCIVSYHSDIVKQKLALRLYSPLMNRFFESVDCIVAAAPNYVETSPTLQKYRHKVKVIPYGLDKASYPVADKIHVDYWRERVGNRFFLFIGAFRYYKGLHFLIQAIKEKDYPLVIVGSGPIEAELKIMARDYKLKNIHFVGALPDLDKVALLELCYSVVFPSHLRSEAFGITLLEGAMFGKPLISCEIGTGTSFININGETGLTVPPADAIALEKAMQTLWNNQDLAESYGINAGLRFNSLFTSTLMSEHYFNLYDEVITNKNNQKR